MAAPADGPEEGAQEQEVVVGLLSRLGQLHRAVDDLMKVGLRDK